MVVNEDCLFCRIARGELEANTIARSEVAMAFRDIAPRAPVHCLVIPLAHVGSLNEATDRNMLAELLSMASAVARQEGIADTGYRVVVNTNADGGQTVGHLHVHVLGGRQMEWPPG